MEKIQNILLRLNTKGEWMQEDLDLLLLEKNGHHDLVRFLIDRECDVNARASDGSTSLILGRHTKHL